MWISFIHLSLIPCVHEFMCCFEVWDPENFILLSMMSYGLSPVLDEACGKQTASFFYFLKRIHTWIVSSV